MTTLNDYLSQKRDAIAALKSRALAPGYQPSRISARVSAEGRSGVRRIRIRDFQSISDSPADFAGYDLGPSSPEVQLGVLGSCLTHSYLIQAATLGVPLEQLEVEVTGQMDQRAGKPGFEHIPVFPHDIAATVHVVSPADAAAIAALDAAVQRSCPILNLLRNPQAVTTRVAHAHPRAAAAD